MLDSAAEGKPGLRRKTENVCAVPHMRAIGVTVPLCCRVSGDRTYGDHQEVLCLIEEKRVVVREGGRIRAGVPDLDHVKLYWV